jgi:hypothetical protein
MVRGMLTRKSVHLARAKDHRGMLRGMFSMASVRGPLRAFWRPF